VGASLEASRSEFTRTAAERLTRLAEIRRLAWADLQWAGRQIGSRPTDAWPHLATSLHIVPVESVRPGDQQVVAAKEPRVHPSEKAIALDVLAAIPSVESILASTRITLSTALPSVTELILYSAPVPDPGFFDLLPNLRSLHASWTSHQGRRLSLAELESHDLRELAVEWLRIEPGDVEKLVMFEDLRRLFLHAGPKDSVKAVGTLRNLEYLFLQGGRSGWARLAPLERLEVVGILEATLPHLNVVRRWGQVRSLWLHGRGVKSLGGVEALKSLAVASLDLPAIADFSPLKGLVALRSVKLGRLSKSGRESVAAFRAARPEVSVDITQPEPVTGELVGAVGIHAPEPENDLPDWWILQDLTDLLDTETNHDAEARLRSAIEDRSPELLRRLSWDSEAGALGVQARSGADILAVAAVINDLASSRRH
jgi:hypothetical protein